MFTETAERVRAREPITIDILYSDLHGSQQTITRMSLNPVGDGQWLGAVSRHWQVSETQTTSWYGRHRPAEA
jgi:hypothetical protein